MTDIRIVDAEFDDGDHARGIVELIDEYAREPAIGSPGLRDEVRETLVSRLRSHPGVLVLLALDGRKPVGVAVCFVGFSTFEARPLVNIHDLAVTTTYQGRGVGTRLVEEIARRARDLDCCRLTLEVTEKNTGARRLYKRLGFGKETGASTPGSMIFLQRPL